MSNTTSTTTTHRVNRGVALVTLAHDFERFTHDRPGLPMSAALVQFCARWGVTSDEVREAVRFAHDAVAEAVARR